MSPLFDRSIVRAFARAGTIGFHMVISTCVGLAMGYGLDRLFDTSPWLTIIFLILGIIAGFRELGRVAKKIADDTD